MWVDFVVGSHPSERFFSGYSGFPLFKKQLNLENVQSSVTLKCAKYYLVELSSTLSNLIYSKLLVVMD